MRIGVFLHQRYQSEDDSRSSTMEMRAQATKEKEVMEDLLGLRVAKLENKIAEQNSKMTKHMVEMYEAIHLFSRPSNQADVHHQFRYAPASASFSPAPEFGKRSGNSNTYAGVTRLAKLDFPRFNGDKIKEWLFQVEQFFEIDHTPDELKVRIASDHFDDLAATWHQWMVQSVLWKHVMHDWMTYKMLLQGRFKELEVDPIVELKQLQETDGIRDYHEKFELIKSRVNLCVNLSEAYLVSIYLAGLRTDTQENVRMFQPQTIQQCFLIGKLYERAHPLKRDKELEAEEKLKLENHENLVQEAILEEESIPQFQVPIANSEILRSSELREVNLGVENLEDVVMNENLEQELVQKNITKRFEVEGDVERSQKVLSIAKNCYAHQVFGKMSQHKERLGTKKKTKGSKTWRFKFKHRGETDYNGVRIKKWCSRFQNVGSAEADWLEGTWFFNSTGIQAKNYADGKLHFDPYMVLHKRLIRSHKIQQRRKMALYPKSWMFKYKRGHKKLHTPTLSKNLRNFHVDHFSHKDIESSEEKQSSQQVIFVDVESLVQQQELNCDRDFVLAMDHGGSSPYVKSETGWFVKTDSISEFELESMDSKMETDSVAHLQDQQLVVAAALSPLFDDFHSDVAEFCEQSTCDKSHKQKQRLSPKSWMFKFKTGSNPNGTSHLNCHNECGYESVVESRSSANFLCTNSEKKKKKSVCFVFVAVKLRYQSW